MQDVVHPQGFVHPQYAPVGSLLKTTKYDVPFDAQVFILYEKMGTHAALLSSFPLCP